MTTTPSTTANTSADNLYANARLYDRICLALGTDEAEPDFYASLLPPLAGGTAQQVLELGCGSGRLALQLAARGLQVTGIDNASAMLDLAREKAALQRTSMDWHLQDLRQFTLNQRFALVLLPSNNLGHLHSLADLQACLRCVQNHLAADGLLVIDYFNPSLVKLALGPGQVFQLVAPGQAADPTLAVTETSAYDAATQTSAVRWQVHSGRRPVVQLNFKLRIWYPQELDALLQLSGLTIVAKFGNYQRQPFDAQTPRQLLVCASAPR